jgi:hypothetical protein
MRALEERRKTDVVARREPGAGAQMHCLHGKDAIVEEVIDWRPFDYVTLATQLPIPGAPKILMSYTFEERSAGETHFEFRIAKPKPKDLPFYEQVRPTVQENFTIGFDILRSMVAERLAGSTVEDEPPLPVSRERFATQPLRAR